MDERRSGTTTRQMQHAPRAAVFIWCNGELGYAVALARHLGRADLEIRGPASLLYGVSHFRGRRLWGLVVDHAATLTEGQRDGLRIVLDRLEGATNG